MPTNPPREGRKEEHQVQSAANGAEPMPSPWDLLDVFLEQVPEPPVVAEKASKVFAPCFLYRGQENWLARLGGMTADRVSDLRQEIRALSARWLKMQNVCVLMGAGSSLYATGFAGSGLLAKVRELLRGRPAATFDALLAKASKPSEVPGHFEEFLSQVAAIWRLQDSSVWPLDKLHVRVALGDPPGTDVTKAELEAVIRDIEKAIAVSCNVPLPASALSGGADTTTPHEVFLAKLVSRDPQAGRARIFTVNYDTLIEQALDRLGIMYCDGFTGTVDRRFNPGAYDLDIHYPGDVGQGKVRRFDKVLLLYKLHGSITWVRGPATGRNPFGISYRRAPIPTQEEILSAGGTEDRLSRVGDGLAILPTAAKYGESLAMPFAHIFRAFAHALGQPQTVLILIGYRGWDLHINQLVEDALSNPGFTLVIVDPVPSDWARLLCRADSCGRVYCLGGEWGRFEFFAHHVLPDLETLHTELAVAKTLRDIRSKPSRDAAAGEPSEEPSA